MRFSFISRLAFRFFISQSKLFVTSSPTAEAILFDGSCSAKTKEATSSLLSCLAALSAMFVVSAWEGSESSNSKYSVSASLTDSELRGRC